MNILDQLDIRSFAVELAIADAPSLFCVWQDDRTDPDRVVAACRTGARGVRLLDGTAGLGWMEPGGRDEDIVVVRRGLASVSPADRAGVNRARQRLIAAGRIIIFVEPARMEPELRRDLPDVFSVTRSSYHLDRDADSDEPDFGAVSSGASVPPSGTTSEMAFRCRCGEGDAPWPYDAHVPPRPR